MRNAQDNTVRTRPHRRVERLLDKLSVSYESEYTEFSPYSLDIFLPEFYCAVEVDGPTHSKAKDNKRDAALMEGYGVQVLHLPLTLTVEELEERLLGFIAHAGQTAKQRRAAWRR